MPALASQYQSVLCLSIRKMTPVGRQSNFSGQGKGGAELGGGRMAQGQDQACKGAGMVSHSAAESNSLSLLQSPT